MKTDFKGGFTVVELLIVIVVIGILTAISIVSYNGITSRAYEARYQNDTAVLRRAVLLARQSTGQNLGQITGSYWSLGACMSDGQNPGNIEPKNLPFSHPCWQRYYETLDSLSEASGIEQHLAD